MKLTTILLIAVVLFVAYTWLLVAYKWKGALLIISCFGAFLYIRPNLPVTNDYELSTVDYRVPTEEIENKFRINRAAEVNYGFVEIRLPADYRLEQPILINGNEVTNLSDDIIIWKIDTGVAPISFNSKPACEVIVKKSRVTTVHVTYSDNKLKCRCELTENERCVS
jgi:hypothetical protein